MITPEKFADIWGAFSGSLDIKMQKTMLKAATYCAGELDVSTKKRLNKRSNRKRPHKTDPNRMVNARSRSGVSGSSGLAGSWAATYFGLKKGVFKAGAYSHLPYAAIHEGGDTIHPKNARALAIPLTTDSEDYRPREFPKTLFFLRTYKKPQIVGVLAERTGVSKAPIKAQYALAKWVTLPATYYISAARKSAAPKVGELLGDGLIQVFHGFIKEEG